MPKHFCNTAVEFAMVACRWRTIIFPLVEAICREVEDHFGTNFAMRFWKTEMMCVCMKCVSIKRRGWRDTCIRETNH